MPPKRKRATDEASQAGDDHQTSTNTNNSKSKKGKKTNTRDNNDPAQIPPKRKRASHDANQDDDENDNNDTGAGTSTSNKRTKTEKKTTGTRDNKRYAYLKPHVRNVPERTIKSKWSTLPEPVQDKVRDMFRALERPVIVRHQNERKRIEAQAAVQAVVRNLGKRLPRMPFPPATKESSFEYEAALDEHRSLEANLATVTDSIGLLKAEIEKEEALLVKETKQLHDMEKNAKRSESERKRQMKNEHPVLRHLDKLPETQDSKPAEFTLADTKDSEATFSELESDPEVQGLLKQLTGHLQSMQTNTAPLTGLKDAVKRSQTALSLLPVPED
ncbi:hypothetical protein SI65_08540 [Aspergillus cristatus]|uniref:CENP-Q, a CENPA-CAD centromere complex subunit-domain-containing protein n=1 Tax=Aspergillus cristatus TaxID=573508 RepID=A0A1E3B6R9_ASPCR|nr:hypothetical protein SI65_08540 [Aspergillus cristatus]